MRIQTIQDILNLGENHTQTSATNPIREDAFAISDDEKIEIIRGHFAKILDTLGLDLQDDSLSGTPYRLAKMYVKEIFSGLNPDNKPVITLFENKFSYGEMIVEKNITLHSICEHHFVPIIGKVHIAYISNGNIIGLSKINRIVQYYAQRPQVQERLTIQIGQELSQALDTPHVAVIVDAKHYCVAMRGVQDQTTTTVTSDFKGNFLNMDKRAELLKYLTI